MNLELYIARKILNSSENKNAVSGPIAKIAVFSIALSIAVVICTVFIVTGFKKEVGNKITGFGGHIQINKLTSNVSYETPPVSKDQDFYPDLDTLKKIKNIQVYATKAGIVKTSDIIQGVVLKGIGPDFNWSFFESNLVEGDIFKVNDSARTNKVIISRTLSRLLKLKVSDKFGVYFVQDPPRMRYFEVSGIYETTLEEFDKLYILADIGHIQRLNGWDPSMVSGFEIILKDFNDLDYMTDEIRLLIGYRILEDGSVLQVSSIKERNIQIFDWLGLFDLNVLVIIIIMLLVAGISMISGLLIMVLEKTQLIGILKSFGTQNPAIKKIFLYISGFVTIRGLFWGNIIGLLLCFLQLKFHLIKLDPSAYFLNAVPVNFSLFYLFLIDICAFITIILVLLIPTSIISKIHPSEIIKYE